MEIITRKKTMTDITGVEGKTIINSPVKFIRYHIGKGILESGICRNFFP